jgi:hypothetical protein
MKQLLVFCLCLLTHLFLYGQPNPDSLKKIISHLQSRGIDTCILFYECLPDRHASGFTDTCTLTNPGYLIWKENNRLFIMKAAQCYDDTASKYYIKQSKPLPVTNASIDSFFKSNFSDIIYEEIYPAIFKYKINGKDAYIPAGVGYHSCYIEIDIHTRDMIYKKGFYEDYLTDGAILHADGSVRHQRESVNYLYNLSTSVYKLSRLLRAMVEDTEARKAFYF